MKSQLHTQALVKLLNEGIFLRLQDIRFIFAHAVVTIPYLAFRGQSEWIEIRHQRPHYTITIR